MLFFGCDLYFRFDIGPRRIAMKNLEYFMLLLTFMLLGCVEIRAEGASRLKLTRVNDFVFSAIGAANAPSYENAGHNNNLSFVITSEGVLVVNGGDNYLLAKALHNSIADVTDQPVRLVVNENGQGHAFLGNSYWSELGVPVIAHDSAREEIRSHGEAILRTMQKRNREKALGTFVVVPEHTFSEKKSIVMGNTKIELLSFGAAHSPGDISVWLPDYKIIIAGDIAFHERLLAIFPDTDVAEWIKSFDRMIALAVAYAIDQSDYAHLNTFEELAVKNAGRLFQTLEMELFE